MNQIPPQQPQQQEPVRRNMVQFRLSDEEAQLLKTMMLETRMSHEQLMVVAFTRLSQIRAMEQKGYRATFVDGEGNPPEEKRIIIPGQK